MAKKKPVEKYRLTVREAHTYKIALQHVGPLDEVRAILDTFSLGAGPHVRTGRNYEFVEDGETYIARLSRPALEIQA